MAKSLKDIPEYDRPRERLVKKGITALSNEDLLMVILGRGMQGVDVKSLARNILKEIQKEPENVTLDRLTNIKGIGIAKGSNFSVIEFAKRFLIKEGLLFKKPKMY